MDLRAGAEGAALEEGDARADGGLREMQGQVGALGQGRVVDALGGQAGPHDVAVLRLGEHVGGRTHRPEHVVTRVGQRRGAHEACIRSDREGCGADGAQHGGARGRQGVVLDGEPVGGSVLTGRLGQAHVQVASRDLDGVGEQGRGRVRRRVVSTVIGRRSRRGRRVRSGFRLLGGGDSVAQVEHGGEADVLSDGDIGGVGDGHDGVGERVGAQGDAHVHGVGLAHAEVLRLRIHAARSECALHGAPGAEVVLGLEEFDLVGGAQSRVCRAHGGRVLVGRTGNEVVGDVDAARGDGQVVGVPHGRGIRVGGAEDRVASANRHWLGVLLRVLGGLGDPACRGGVAGDVDRLDRGCVGAQELGDGRAAAFDDGLGQEVAVDGDPRAPAIGGDARVDRDVGEVVVTGVGALRVVRQGERRGGGVAVRARGAGGVVGGDDVLDGAVGGVRAADLPDQRGDR